MKEEIGKQARYIQSNTMTNLLNFMVHLIAFIYSFGVLYAIGANAVLWLVWALLQFIIFFNSITYMLKLKERQDYEAEQLEKWKRDTIETIRGDIQEQINFDRL